MRRRLLLYICCLVLLIAVPFAAIAEELPSWAPPSIGEVETMLEGLPFDEFLDEVSRVVVFYAPLGIPIFGLGELLGVRNDRLGLSGIAHTKTQIALSQVILTALESYDHANLPFNQRVSYDALAKYFATELSIAGNASLFWQSVGPARNSSLSVLEDILRNDLPSDSRDDLDDYIVLLWQLDDLVWGWIENIEQSEDAAILLPQAEYAQIKGTLKRLSTLYGVRTHPYYLLGRNKLSTVAIVSEEYRASFLQRLEEVIEDNVAPAFDELLTVVERISPLAPSEMMWANHSVWPDYYRGELRETLGMAISPEDIVAMANAEIERLTAEIASLRTHGDREPLPVGDMLRELWGPRLGCTYSYTAGAMLDDAHRLYDTAIVSASSLFHQLPESELRIMLADVDNPQYELASLDGVNPARFLIPTDAMFEKNNLPTLIYHEAIPGHHLQVEIARSADIPLLFQFNPWPGFAEGWAEYAEELADESGWHSTNMCARVTFLDNQLMIAYLSAIESGLCGLGWDMDQAVEYIQPYIPATRAQLEPVFSTFFYDPTQYTRYFVGRIVILQERERARLLLGACFNLADFHQAVLEHGNIPLDLLSTLIDEYIKQESRGLLVQ